MAASRCSSSPCLYIPFTSPSVNTQAHMHIQNKQANKHYPSSDTAQRASAGCSANNNDSTRHNRMTVKYSTSPLANYKNKSSKSQLLAKQPRHTHGSCHTYHKTSGVTHVALMHCFSSFFEMPVCCDITENIQVKSNDSTLSVMLA